MERAPVHHRPKSRAESPAKLSRADVEALKSVSPVYNTVAVQSNIELPSVTWSPAPDALRGTRMEDLPHGSVRYTFPDETGDGAKSSKKAKFRYPGTVDSAFAAHQMVDVNATGDRTAVIRVNSPDFWISWRISSGRYVEVSSDAGKTWRTQWTSPTAYITAGSSPSPHTCWLVGKAGIVLVSADGAKWHVIEPPSNADFTDVIASDALTATITDASDREYQTVDGGKHWVLAP